MEISTYAALCRGKVSGSWSSGKNDVKDASKAAECIINMIARGSTWCRSRIYLPLAILISTLMAPCATTGGGLVTAYRDCKSAARFKSEALYSHWTWSLNTHTHMHTLLLAVNYILHFTELHHGDEKLTEIANFSVRFYSAPPDPPHRSSHLHQPESQKIYRTPYKKGFSHTFKLHLNEVS